MKKNTILFFIVAFSFHINAQNDINTINQISEQVAINLSNQLNIKQSEIKSFVDSTNDLIIYFSLPKNSNGDISLFSEKSAEFISTKTAEKFKDITFGGIPDLKNYIFSYETNDLFSNNNKSYSQFDLTWNYIFTDSLITFTNIKLKSNTKKDGFIALKNITIQNYNLNKDVIKPIEFNFFNSLMQLKPNNLGILNSLSVIENKTHKLFPKKLDSVFAYNKIDTLNQYHFEITLNDNAFIYIIGYNPLDGNNLNVIYPVMANENKIFNIGNNSLCNDFPLIFRDLTPNEDKYILKFILTDKKIDINSFSQKFEIEQNIFIDVMTQDDTKNLIMFLHNNNIKYDCYQTVLLFNQK